MKFTIKNNKGIAILPILLLGMVVTFIAFGGGVLGIGNDPFCEEKPNNSDCVCLPSEEKRTYNSVPKRYYCEDLTKVVDLSAANAEQQITTLVSQSLSEAYPQCNTVLCSVDDLRWEYGVLEIEQNTGVERQVKAYCVDNSNNIYSSGVVDIESGELIEGLSFCQNYEPDSQVQPSLTVSPKTYSTTLFGFDNGDFKPLNGGEEVKKVNDNTLKYLYSWQLYCPKNEGVGVSRQTFQSPESLQIANVKFDFGAGSASAQLVSVNGNIAVYDVSSSCEGRGAAPGSTFGSNYELIVELVSNQICKSYQTGNNVNLITNDELYCSNTVQAQILNCKDGEGISTGQSFAVCQQGSDGFYYRAKGTSVGDPLTFIPN